VFLQVKIGTMFKKIILFSNPNGQCFWGHPKADCLELGLGQISGHSQAKQAHCNPVGGGGDGGPGIRGHSSLYRIMSKKTVWIQGDIGKRVDILASISVQGYRNHS
jgi:hypothetical protein